MSEDEIRQFWIGLAANVVTAALVAVIVFAYRKGRVVA